MSGRCGILGLGKGRSAGLDRETERRRIIESFDVLNVPEGIQALIREALDSDKWDWFRDCDGCTAVSEIYWPTIYFPPCLRHDFDCHDRPQRVAGEPALLPHPARLRRGARCAPASARPASRWRGMRG